MRRRWVTGVAVLAIGIVIAAPVWAEKPQPFSKVRARLMKAERTVVGSACGAAMGPWGYRGDRGKGLELRNYRETGLTVAESRELVDELLRASEWGGPDLYRGKNKPCDQVHAFPLFTVTWHGGTETYAVISFEHRSAVLFEGGRPLGSTRFVERADALFARIQRALPDDSLVQALTLPPEEPKQLFDSFSVEGPMVPEMPEVIRKVQPTYPPSALADEREGRIEVRALVGPDGKVQDAFVAPPTSRDRALADAALEAAWQWEFRPAKWEGKPVAVWLMVPISFRMK